LAGLGARSQNVSGTKKKMRKKQKPTTIAVIQKTHLQPRDCTMTALTSGIRFLPPRSSSVYMPRRYALSWRKNISAMVALGRHSTGETAKPWTMRATTREA
jgi:hypothetical protein